MAPEQALPGTIGRVPDPELADHILDCVAGDSRVVGREHVEKGGFCQLRDGPLQLPDTGHFANGHVNKVAASLKGRVGVLVVEIGMKRGASIGLCVVVLFRKGGVAECEC